MGIQQQMNRRLAWLQRIGTRLGKEARAIPLWIWLCGVGLAFVLGIFAAMHLKMSLAAAVGMTVIVLSALYPKAALYGVFGLLISEGAIRKWLIPGAQDLIYFGKDAVLLGIYAGVVFRGNLLPNDEIVPLKTWMKALLWVTCGFLVLEVFNPRNPSLILAGFGLRNYIFYIGLMFVVPVLFRSRSELYTFLKIQIFFVIPVCLLGIVQFFSPADSVLNKYANEHHNLAVASFGAEGEVRARITSSFSYITGYAAWLTVMILAVFPFYFASGKSERRLYAIPLGLLVGNLLMTGSRGPVFLLVGSLPIFIQGAYLGIKDRTEALLIRKRMVTRLAVGALLMGVLLATVFHDPLEGLIHRSEVVQDRSARIEKIFLDPFRYAADSGAFGWGLAMTHQARDVLLAKSGDYAIVPEQTEEETIRVMQELGIFGWVLWYTLRITLLIWVFSCFRDEKDSFFRLILLVVMLVQLTSLPVSMVLNHTLLFLYWFFLGVARVPMRYTGIAEPLRRKRYY